MIKQYGENTPYIEKVPAINKSSAIQYLISRIAYKTRSYVREIESMKIGWEENYKLMLRIMQTKTFKEKSKESLEWMLNAQSDDVQNNVANVSAYRTDRLNRDTPWGKGEFETYAEFIKDGVQVCKPWYQAVQAEYYPKNTLNYVQMIYAVDSTHHNVKQDHLWLVCQNEWNTAERPCLDYQVQFLCQK